jgi:hypothetical protein
MTDFIQQLAYRQKRKLNLWPCEREHTQKMELVNQGLQQLQGMQTIINLLQSNSTKYFVLFNF